jgi:hypothetical protein
MDKRFAYVIELWFHIQTVNVQRSAINFFWKRAVGFQRYGFELSTLLFLCDA